MKRTSVLLCVLIQITCLWGGLAAASDKDVFVTNTSATPVPITGNVGITGTPNVNVANTVAVPVEIRHQEPFTGSIFGISLGDGVTFQILVGAQVPTGKRLVVEYFSCEMLSPAGEAYVFAIRNGSGPNPTDGYSGAAYLPVTPVALSGGDGGVSAGQSIRLYIGAGDYPQIVISRSGSTSSIANGECHYVGYLEDVP